MNVAQMLLAKVTPLSEYKPDRTNEYQVRRLSAGKSQSAHGNMIAHSTALARYQAVWQPGDEWLATREIEIRLGAKRSTAMATLKKWASDKYQLIESRPLGGHEFNRRHGLEWRWK